MGGVSTHMNAKEILDECERSFSGEESIPYGGFDLTFIPVPVGYDRETGLHEALEINDIKGNLVAVFLLFPFYRTGVNPLRRTQ